MGWFFGIAFGFSWFWMALPWLLSRWLAPEGLALARTLCWSIAMWGPGLGAMVAVRRAGEPWSALGLTRLGRWWAYLVAWALPWFWVWAAWGLSLLTGLARPGAPDLPGLPALPWPVWMVLSLPVALIGGVLNLGVTLGEELGWRGYLLPRWRGRLGTGSAVLLSGLVWGVWHLPAVLQGLNYPGHPAIGALLMPGFTTLLGAALAWLYWAGESVWLPALAHGALNAIANLPALLVRPGWSPLWGVTVASVAGWAGLALTALLLWGLPSLRRLAQP